MSWCHQCQGRPVPCHTSLCWSLGSRMGDFILPTCTTSWHDRGCPVLYWMFLTLTISLPKWQNKFAKGEVQAVRNEGCLYSNLLLWPVQSQWEPGLSALSQWEPGLSAQVQWDAAFVTARTGPGSAVFCVHNACGQLTGQLATDLNQDFCSELSCLLYMCILSIRFSSY